MAKLLAENFGETKKSEWSTFIVSWGQDDGEWRDGDQFKHTPSVGSKVTKSS